MPPTFYNANDTSIAFGWFRSLGVSHDQPIRKIICCITPCGSGESVAANYNPMSFFNVVPVPRNILVAGARIELATSRIWALISANELPCDVGTAGGTRTHTAQCQRNLNPQRLPIPSQPHNYISIHNSIYIHMPNYVAQTMLSIYLFVRVLGVMD